MKKLIHLYTFVAMSAILMLYIFYKNAMNPQDLLAGKQRREFPDEQHQQPLQLQPEENEDIVRPDERNFLNSAVLRDKYTVRNQFYYVWCGNKYFELRHYLAVSSVIYYMQPDNIIMYYGQRPRHDTSGYYTWLTELVADFPFFTLKNDSRACSEEGTPNIKFVIEQILQNGGVFVDETLVLTKPIHEHRKENGCMQVIDTEAQNKVVLFMTAGNRSRSDCKSVSVEQLNGVRVPVAGANLSLLSFDDEQMKTSKFLLLLEQLYPKNIWELDNGIGRILRTVMYGKPDIARPTPSYEELVPNIAHSVWFGNEEMNFIYYLSVLSLLHIQKVDALYIHGETPRGFYWDLVKHDARMKIVPRMVTHVYGDERITTYLQKLSNVIRVDALLRYGGIYIDGDAIFVRPLSREIRGYDAVISLDVDTTTRDTKFPESFNNGAMIGKRNARFWRMFLESMKEYRPYQYFWMGLQQPYKVKERFPTSVLIDPYLQVICSYDQMCRPSSRIDLKYEDFTKLKFVELIPNWKNFTYVYHFTKPRPPVFDSHIMLLKSDDTAAQMGRLVLEEAGMLQHFMDLMMRRNETSQ